MLFALLWLGAGGGRRCLQEGAPQVCGGIPRCVLRLVPRKVPNTVDVHEHDLKRTLQVVITQYEDG